MVIPSIFEDDIENISIMTINLFTRAKAPVKRLIVMRVVLSISFSKRHGINTILPAWLSSTQPELKGDNHKESIYNSPLKIPGIGMNSYYKQQQKN